MVRNLLCLAAFAPGLTRVAKAVRSGQPSHKSGDILAALPPRNTTRRRLARNISSLLAWCDTKKDPNNNPSEGVIPGLTYIKNAPHNHWFIADQHPHYNQILDRRIIEGLKYHTDTTLELTDKDGKPQTVTLRKVPHSEKDTKTRAFIIAGSAAVPGTYSAIQAVVNADMYHALTSRLPNMDLGGDLNGEYLKDIYLECCCGIWLTGFAIMMFSICAFWIWFRTHQPEVRSMTRGLIGTGLFLLSGGLFTNMSATLLSERWVLDAVSHLKPREQVNSQELSDVPGSLSRVIDTTDVNPNDDYFTLIDAIPEDPTDVAIGCGVFGTIALFLLLLMFPQVRKHFAGCPKPCKALA